MLSSVCLMASIVNSMSLRTDCAYERAALVAASAVLASAIRARVSLYSPMVVVPPPVSSSMFSIAPRMSLTSEVNARRTFSDRLNVTTMPSALGR